ncbi:MAG TPA: SDR family NAD(P)-dependent oxidoreductase [Roseiarcus sp.]|jgi:3-oxoacyl-[acyl-carrier protein] reductase|nr:SDR family NAD(P)-dependent oxidoreductase [Roseiarcus sp.]
MKTIVVTGVSRGLGLAIAVRLAADGYRIVGMSRTNSEAYQALMSRLPGQAEFQPLDLSDVESIAGVARETTRRSGPLYGLVNNAGVEHSGVLATMREADIERVVRTNLLGPITLTGRLMRSMLAKGEGRIVCISSIVARRGFHGLSVYSATKAGLEGFARSLSREAGKRGVTVNCVAPGYMETDMTAGLPAGALESVRRRAPLGLPRPDQVAAAVSYLMTPEACTVTGTVLTVDGGGSA